MSMVMYRFIRLIVPLIATCVLISCAGETNSDSHAAKPGTSVSDSHSITEPENHDSTAAKNNLKRLENEHKENPIDYTVAFQLIQEYENQGMIDDAINVLEEYIAGDDLLIAERARLDHALLLAAYKDDEKDKAYEDLLDIAESGSEILSSEAYFQLGNMIAVEGYNPPDGDKKELAKLYYRKASELEPANALLYRRLADLMYSDGEIDEAREYLAIFLVVYPDDLLSWLDLADWSVESDDVEKARKYYKRVAECDIVEFSDRAKKALMKLE